MSLLEMEEYRQFTKPAELHKAINTLKGIVAGITTDNVISTDEMQELSHWCFCQSYLRDRHPFNELIPLLEASIEDGVIDEDERFDILWLCNNFIHDSKYYDLITSSIQFLFGLLHGIMADGIISDAEIHTLEQWVDTNSYLERCYPFDEIKSMLVSILADGVITQEERDQLKAFFSDFIDLTASYNLSEPELSKLKEEHSISGICAVTPTISFTNKKFCFTGSSQRAKRADFAALITEKEGVFRSNVSKDTDYLIVGDNGNPCWAYSCYGRKIEEAVTLRRQGAKVMIVHEYDFWDAVHDY